MLRRGGQFLLLEHGLSPEPEVARWQHRLTPLQSRLGGGCHFNRDTRQLLQASGLKISQLGHYYLHRVPRFAGYMTEGRAVRT